MDAFINLSSKTVYKASRIESIENVRKEYEELLKEGWKETNILEVISNFIQIFFL